MSDQQKEYNNENLHVIVSRLPGSKVKLDIDVTPLGAQAAYDKAIKVINKEVTLPGFRKGKAPDQYIVQKYQSAVEEEWRSILVNTAFSEALDLIQIFPFTKNSVQRPQIKEASKEAGAKISIEFESHPDVPEINLSGLSVKKETPKAVTQQQKDDVITQIQLSHAKWNDVETPIKEGDYVDLDIYNIDGNSDICKDTRFLVQPGKIGQWLINLLVGKKVGDTAEGVSENEMNHTAETCTDPSHDHSHDHEFKPTRCRISIKGHKQAELPPLDDALATKAGVPTVAELLVRIEESLVKREENDIKHRQISEIEKQLTDKYTFDIPDSLLQQQIKANTQHTIEHLDASLIGQARKDAIKEIEENAAKEIAAAYRMYFITEKIAKDHKLEISQEEIMQEFMKQMVNPQSAIINQNMQPEEMRARLSSYLLSEKTRALMVEKASQVD